VLAEGSLVEILPPEGSDQAPVQAAVSGGFLSVADDKVSVLAAQAMLSDEVDVPTARQELDAAMTDRSAGEDEPSEVKYARARLRLAGEQV
jgi:F-type H+-transporting ATPase subunit epsilon